MKATPFLCVLMVTAVAVFPAHAQEGSRDGSGSSGHAGLVGDLLDAVTTVRQKMLSLAEAIPETSYDWRPGEGVRSVGEVLLHVSADNYLLPTAAGVEPPSSTGIDGESYESVQAFESRTATKAEAMAHLEASFDHLQSAMGEASTGSMSKQLSIYGMELTGQELWIMATTHLHEHLGQLIAYARTNGVVPPWSA